MSIDYNANLSAHKDHDCEVLMAQQFRLDASKKLKEQHHGKGCRCGYCHGCKKKITQKEALVCKRCLRETYCSKACQISVWPIHKKQCGQLHDVLTAFEEKALIQHDFAPIICAMSTWVNHLRSDLDRAIISALDAVASADVPTPNTTHALLITTTLESRQPDPSLRFTIQTAKVVPFYELPILDFRSNIGNANVAGLSVDLGLKGNQYGTIVSVVYATYVVFEPVWSNLLKIVTPRILLSVSTLVWGILTLSTAWVRTYDAMVAIRLLLGLFPCLNLVLSMNYRPEEFATRLSYIFSAAAISGAFGGLLAFGLTQISGGPFSTRWGPYFVIPNTLTKAWFLNDNERELAAVRYEINKENYDPDEKFSWQEVGHFPPKNASNAQSPTAFSAVNQFCVDVSLYGVTTFMPTIIKGLEITVDPVYSQLLTVPVYLVAAVSFIIGARISDRYRTRSVPLLVYATIMIIGYIIIAVAHSPAVRYFGVFVTG
ncbi:hypothetical protein RQP46_004763 [Phenoliferia psychrophenolica]